MASMTQYHDFIYNNVASQIRLIILKQPIIKTLDPEINVALRQQINDNFIAINNNLRESPLWH